MGTITCRAIHTRQIATNTDAQVSEYTEPPKNSARHEVLTSAIESLTTNRNQITLARRSYVRDTREYLLKYGSTHDQSFARTLTDKTIDSWEAFYDSLVQDKSASGLKVAYLSGPNPENDLREFCKAGVLPENIWAFESNNSTYSEAVVSALASEFPFIKIVNCGIDTFLESTPSKFDIVYLDFCGPLPNRDKKQKTLSTITKVLKNHALNSPGALITNVALPSKEQDSIGHDLLAKLVAIYLYPKNFLEPNTPTSEISDGPTSLGLSPDEWLKTVNSDLDRYYSQFVTRLLIDHAMYISPYDRFPNKSKIFNTLFNINDTKAIDKEIEKLLHFDTGSDGGDVICEPGQWSVLWSLTSLIPKLNAKDINYPDWIFSDAEFGKFATMFCDQLSSDFSSATLSNNISKMSYLLSQGHQQELFYSSGLTSINKHHTSFTYYQFCDLFLFHQVSELLFRQLAHPYHVNVDAIQRWKYTAKKTPMFMDLIILDECRYLYDWMPTVDMFASGMDDLQRQLAYRFALDGISKHRRWYNTELLYGTSVLSQSASGFEAKCLHQRKLIS